MHIHISYISPKVPEVYQTEHVPDAINISSSPQAIRADKWIHLLGVWDSFSILSLPNQSLQPPLSSWSIYFFVFIILSLLLTHCHCLYWGHQSEVKTVSLLAFILGLLPIHTPPTTVSDLPIMDILDDIVIALGSDLPCSQYCCCFLDCFFICVWLSWSLFPTQCTASDAHA